jgi:hypothetical protein
MLLLSTWPETMVRLLGKSVRFAHGVAGFVVEGEVEAGEEKGPPGLASV